MAKFIWQDGTLVSKAKVTIGGQEYEVDPAEYSGDTPLTATNLNAMEDGIYEDIDSIQDEVERISSYSTNEIVIGTWIDGRPIYRKYYDVGNVTANTEKEISLNISNYARTIDIKGNNTIETPYNYDVPVNFYNIRDTKAQYCFVDRNLNAIKFRSSWPARNLIIILDYIKSV